MKIAIAHIPIEGLSLREEIDPKELDIDTDIIKLCSPVSVEAEITRITNSITAKLALSGVMLLCCSRCLNEFKLNFEKNIGLNFALDKDDLVLDLLLEIRDQIILDYPIKPLCSTGCRGLCPKCGANLNEGECGCC
ncbi:MAG: DUF177 domain-containing protein [Candidatus Omnitrophica bacterium]|nr:DUF177 domain-containing protein [Candidatus Omnitrophota bacterium]